MPSWQLQAAKARLSEVVQRCRTEGPQEITRRGEPVAVELSEADYRRLSKKKPSWVEIMRRSPLAGISLPLVRDRSSIRKVSH